MSVTTLHDVTRIFYGCNVILHTRPGGGSGESGGVIATYCFSTSAIKREYEGLVIVSLTVVTRSLSVNSVVLGTSTENSPNTRDGATAMTGDSVRIT